MERKTRSALVSASLPPVCEATQSQPREVQQKSAGFGSFWKQPLYKCDSPMKMIRAEGAVGWINARPTRFAPWAVEIRSPRVQSCPPDCGELRHWHFF